MILVLIFYRNQQAGGWGVLLLSATDSRGPKARPKPEKKAFSTNADWKARIYRLRQRTAVRSGNGNTWQIFLGFDNSSYAIWFTSLHRILARHKQWVPKSRALW